jgi:osmotically-inducible protein OsmY
MARLGTGITLLIGAAAGAAAQYFLDGQSGRRRRHTAREQGLSTVREQATEAAKKVDNVAGHAKGAVASVIPHSDSHKHDDLGDAGLARKVESEIFRAADAPKGKVAVNAENGVVFLRGEVDREWIDRLGRDAENVDGVMAVRNLLHTPGTPAPTAPGQGWSAPAAGIS